MKKEDLRAHYIENRDEIESRLEEFEELREASEDRLFRELVFVILTSQTEAEKAWKAVEQLDRNNLIDEGGKEEIEKVLAEEGVSYERNKASYIVENREKLSQPTLENPERELKLREKIDPENLERTRKWLAENIKGLSWKGASHFLRNIGYGNSFAIISSHISKTMHQLGLTDSPEPPSNRKEYMEREEKLKQLAGELEIEVKALDLVIWSRETGEIFK